MASPRFILHFEKRYIEIWSYLLNGRQMFSWGRALLLLTREE